MATKQLTSLDAYVIPRVNLLPPEIGAKRAERRSYVFMGVAVASAGAAVVALYLGQASRVSSAKKELARAQSENRTLTTERAGLQNVQDTYAQVDANEALITRAYSTRVLWSVYLHNISLQIPENVWITQLTADATPPAIGAVPVPGKITPAGSFTFAGKGFEYNDLAAWLDSVAKIKGVVNASFSSAQDEKPTSAKGRTVVKFTSTALLTPAAITPHKIPGSK
jgi:Tfp pilus assembly protein PilN